MIPALANTIITCIFLSFVEIEAFDWIEKNDNKPVFDLRNLFSKKYIVFLIPYTIATAPILMFGLQNKNIILTTLIGCYLSTMVFLFFGVSFWGSLIKNKLKFYILFRIVGVVFVFLGIVFVWAAKHLMHS